MSLLICLFTALLSACDSENMTSTNDEEYWDSREFAYVSSSQVMYLNTTELSQAATDVIRGEVLDVRVELRNTSLSKEETIEDMKSRLTEEAFIEFYGEGLDWMSFESSYEIVTIHRIRIIEIFQGNYQIGDTIEVMQRGGTYDDRTLSNSDLISFEAGDDLVFFITSWSHLGRPSVLINSFQSVYRFPAVDENARSLDLDVELENVYGDTHFNDLRITLNDLLQLAENQD